MKCIILFSTLIAVASAATELSRINSEGIKIIKRYEVFHPEFFHDQTGWKIGFDHRCGREKCRVPINQKYRVPLNKQTGEQLLLDDLYNYEVCVQNAVRYPKLTNNQFSALVSFAFSQGCDDLKGSRLLGKLNAGNVQGAADEFSGWVYVNGKRHQHWVERRHEERNLFCAGGSCKNAEKPNQSCRGVVNGFTGLLGAPIRQNPNINSRSVGTQFPFSSVEITGRYYGLGALGNNHWFRIPRGYISTNFIDITRNNGAPWCRN